MELSTSGGEGQYATVGTAASAKEGMDDKQVKNMKKFPSASRRAETKGSQ